jgi:glutamine amidotransferase
MRFLEKYRENLKKIIANGVPILGICLGMQVLFEESEEGGIGLSVFKGKVIRLPPNVKVPHMGWNSVKIRRKDSLIRDIKDGSFFYFVHSYAPVAGSDIVIGTTDYGIEFASIVGKDGIYGVQFHPEKSGPIGLQILKNFVEMVGDKKC